MKKINDFLNEASLIKVWLVLYPIIGLFISLLIYGLDYIDNENYMFKSQIKYLYFGATMSIVFTTMVILMLSMGRKSMIFWQYAKYVEGLINDVKTKEVLESIWDREYRELINKCQGGPQIAEVKRIKAIIQTRYKYWKE
jgi:hypothetical protein